MISSPMGTSNKDVFASELFLALADYQKKTGYTHDKGCAVSGGAAIW
jgi:hypothetical protein